MLLRFIIDAKEERGVAVIDLPNSFIQTRIDNEKYMAIIKIRGILVDVLLDIVPDVYGMYVTADKNITNKLVAQCINAIYGTMVASLLYYCNFL